MKQQIQKLAAHLCFNSKICCGKFIYTSDALLKVVTCIKQEHLLTALLVNYICLTTDNLLDIKACTYDANTLRMVVHLK